MDKATSTDPVTMNQSDATYEILSQPKVIDTQVNTEVSVSNPIISKGSSTNRPYHQPHHRGHHLDNQLINITSFKTKLSSDS